MHPERTDSNLGPGDITFALVMIVAAVLLGLLHLAGSGFNCAWDTSTCAETSEKNGVYEGTLRSEDGEVYRSSQFVVEFGSLGEDSEVPFVTDEYGGFCIHWASDSYFEPRTPTRESLEVVPFPGQGTWRGLNGTDPPPGCQESDESIPWDRAEDAESSWQYRLLLLLPIAAVLALLWAVFGRRTRYAFHAYVAGGLLLLADLVAFVLL